MPRFHFEILDGEKLEDPVGIELSTHSQARKLAKEIAQQVADDIDDTSFNEVVVKTDNGEEIFKTPIPKDV